MSATSRINHILREMPLGMPFADRLSWLEQRETVLRGSVKKHSDGVVRFVTSLARSIGFSSEFIAELDNAARWHDIGKLATPDHILDKPSKLDESEIAIMQCHAMDGSLLLGSDAPLMWREVAEFHHERYDGFGYHGLKGEDIPQAARLVAIADVFDALTQKRIYKEGMPIEAALRIMTANVDSPGFGRRAFDPIFLRSFVADFLNHDGYRFSDDGRKELNDFVASDPMSDLNLDKYSNDGWLLKSNGKRIKYSKADSGNDRLIAIYNKIGELIVDNEEIVLSINRKIA